MAQAKSITNLKDTGVTVAPEDTINEILPFCAQGQEGRDLLSQAEYAQDMQRNIGHQPGIARAQLANKQARQVSHLAAGLAQFLARRYAPGVVDDGDLDKVEAALVGALDAVIKSPAHLATLLRAGLMQPDGATVTVDEDGLLSAIGGNLLMNSEVWITESGTFTAPVAGLYDLWVIGGGAAAYSWLSGKAIMGGDSGCYVRALKYLQKGQEVSVTIGAGGIASQTPDAEFSTITGTRRGGNTTFGDIIAYGALQPIDNAVSRITLVAFSGEVDSGILKDTEINLNAVGGGPSKYGFYGTGGHADSRWINASLYSHIMKDGVQGAVYVCYHDPGKAAGPLAAPAPLSARRMAPRAVSAPVTVNLYDPETGQGSVWREEDAEAKLAEGLISEEAWRAICAEKAAEERETWLQSPDTVEQRFQMLRAAQKAKLAATDYLVAPDYPLAAEQRAAVMEYRQALRDLPAQEGAPWDGGGELTPWPELPDVEKSQDA